MKKREFLALGGAVPLMLTGCGNGTGSAPVRLVNASVGYSKLGFMVQSTQATSTDVEYGAASPFETVQAGAVTMSLTVASGTGETAVSTNARTLNKDQRYSLIAYGFKNELKSLLMTESSVTPDSGKVNVNVLNTSLDIGAVDVYLSPGTDISVGTLISGPVGVAGQTQSAFASMPTGSYYITVVGAGSVSEGISDLRFQSQVAYSWTDQQVITLILTPGASGTLANVVVLTQGTTAAANATVSEKNATARLRAVTSVGSQAVTVAGVLSASNPQYSDYMVVAAGAPPAVTVGGGSVAVVASTDMANKATPTSLDAGGDYTLMVYLDGGGNPTASMLLDDNTAPVKPSGVRFRLINLASNSQAGTLSMSVNSVSVASLVPYGKASAYQEITTPQNIGSTIEVLDGTTVLSSRTLPLLTPNIYTDIVVGVSSGVAADFLLASAITN